MPTPEAQSHRTKVALAIASVAILLSLAAAGGALISRFSITNEARHNNALVWHGVICSIENFTVQRSDISREKKVTALKFYDNLLVQNVKTTPCGLVEKLNRR